MIIPHLYIVDLVHTADMDESYGTYVDDEYFDNHDYADDTDDDTDDDIDDDTDDVVGPWNMYNSGGLRVHSVGGSRRQWRVGIFSMAKMDIVQA